jgi:hypothetical protein
MSLTGFRQFAKENFLAAGCRQRGFTTGTTRAPGCGWKCRASMESSSFSSSSSKLAKPAEDEDENDDEHEL